MSDSPQQLLRISAAALAAVLVASCAIIPAELKPDRDHVAVEDTLGGLLEQSLAEPRSAHNAHALAHFVGDWFEARGGVASGEIDEGEGRRFRVRFDDEVIGSYLPGYFDQLEPAVEYRVKRIERHTREGIGAPMLALRENQRREEIETFYPPEAITRPVTAVAFEGAPRDGYRTVTVRLLCSLCNETAEIDGETLPLAADFSTSWAALLGRAKGLKRAEIRDVLTRTPKREPRLYLTEPYDPNKEPLIMVHGLLDTPLKWAELSNDLRAIDDIRKRYQIWHYLYNTSAPALYSGRILRTQLRELRPLLDPEGDDPAMQRTTVLAHSMGGIVSRSLITRPGNAFWDAAFTRPIEELELSEKDRESLREAFFWEPERHVKRVIFAAVPHRGSDIADSFLGKLGRALVGPPRQFQAFYERVSEANPGAFTEAYARLGTGRLDSVHALSPEQPTLKILSELPLSHEVAVHSLIGDRGKDGPLEDSHDGLVPYWSAHLDDADSEKVIPSGHNVMEHPEGVAEIVRLLRLP